MWKLRLKHAPREMVTELSNAIEDKDKMEDPDVDPDSDFKKDIRKAILWEHLQASLTY